MLFRENWHYDLHESACRIETMSILIPTDPDKVDGALTREVAWPGRCRKALPAEV